MSSVVQWSLFYAYKRAMLFPVYSISLKSLCSLLNSDCHFEEFRHVTACLAFCTLPIKTCMNVYLEIDWKPLYCTFMALGPEQTKLPLSTENSSLFCCTLNVLLHA